MTHPTDAAIAQAFRELQAAGGTFAQVYAAIERRARELDAEKGGACDVPGVVSAYCQINGCHAMTLPAITPPAQAAEAVADELVERLWLAENRDQIRAAIAAMREGG